MKSIRGRKASTQEEETPTMEIDPGQVQSALPTISSNRFVEYLAWSGFIAIVVLALGACLLFAPLILAGIEYLTVGTNYVEDFFRTIQLHEPLSRVYEPIIEKLRSLFGYP